MPLHFITSSERKFQEFTEILGREVPLTRVEINLDEIQSLDPQEVIRHKLKAAEQHAPGRYIVEDSSVTLACLNNQLPGPFVKWFYDALGCQGLVEIVDRAKNNRASVCVSIGYVEPGLEPRFFDATVQGCIVTPRGDKDFGFGPVFRPDGSANTFGEMDRDEKHALSPRGEAVRKLKAYLLSRGSPVDKRTLGRDTSV